LFFFFQSHSFLFSEVFNVILNNVPEFGVFNFNEGGLAEDDSLVQQVNIFLSSQFRDMLLSKLKTFNDSFSLVSSKFISNFFDGWKEIFVPEFKIILVAIFNQASDDFGIVLSAEPSRFLPDDPEEVIIEEIFSHQFVFDGQFEATSEQGRVHSSQMNRKKACKSFLIFSSASVRFSSEADESGTETLGSDFMDSFTTFSCESAPKKFILDSQTMESIEQTGDNSGIILGKVFCGDSNAFLDPFMVVPINF